MKLLCVPALVLAILGCSSVVSRRVPRDADRKGQAEHGHLTHKAQGLAYFLPLGKVHIVAVRNDISLTNFALQVRRLEGGQVVTNLVTRVVPRTNTLSTTYSPTNYTIQHFPTVGIYSNFLLAVSNQIPPSVTSSNTTSGVSWTTVSNPSPAVGTSAPPGGSSVTLSNPAPTSASAPGSSVAGSGGGNPSGSTTSSTNTLTNTTFTSASVPTVQTTTITASNAPALLYPLASVYSNDTRVTITTEQPLVYTNYTYTVTISADYAADAANLFVLNPQTDWFHDDTVNLTVDNNGLLSTLVTSNADQTGNIVIALAQAAGEAFELMASGGAAAPATTGPPTPGAPNFPQFRDADDLDWTKLAADLLNDGTRTRLELRLGHERESGLQQKYRAWRSAASDLEGAVATNTPAVSEALDNAVREWDAATRTSPAATGAWTKVVQTLDATAKANAPALSQLVTNEVHALAELRASVAANLNDIITGPMLDATAFLEAGVALRPKTRWLAEALAVGQPEQLKQRVLNRLLLEDAFPLEIGIARIDVPFEIKPPTPPLPPPQQIDISFNPFEPKELKAAEAELKTAGLVLANEETFASAPDPYARLHERAPHKTGGIYYRPAFPYEVRIKDAANNVVAKSLPLPNRAPILHLDMSKAPLVTQVTQLSMTNGFLTSYGISKPSSALALAGMPVTVLSSFTSGVTNLIQLKLNIATARNSLTQAALAQQANQMLALSNTIALLTLQQQLNAALAASKTNAPPTAGTK